MNTRLRKNRQTNTTGYPSRSLPAYLAGFVDWRGSGYCFSGCRAARCWEATQTEIFLAAPREFSAKRVPCA